MADKWLEQLNQLEPLVFTFEDDNMITFMDVKACFSNSQYVVNSIVAIEVFVR